MIKKGAKTMAVEEWEIKFTRKGPIPEPNLYSQDLRMSQAGAKGIRGEVRRMLFKTSSSPVTQDHSLAISNPDALKKGKGR